MTVAYERLTAEGFVTSRQGSGTFVAEMVTLAGREKTGRRSTGLLKPRPIWEAMSPPTTFETARFDFRAGLCNASLFPHKAWRRSVVWALRSGETTAGVYEHPAGHRDLRAAIARHIGISRGVRASADDIVVTNGTQQALDVLARVLLAPGDGIAVEDPELRPAEEVVQGVGHSRGWRAGGSPGAGRQWATARSPSRVCHAFSSISPFGNDDAAAPAGAAGLGRAEQRGHHRRRLRQRVPFRGPASRAGADARRKRPGRLRRLLLKDNAADASAGLPGDAAIAAGALHKAKFVTDWHSSTLAQAALARFIDEGAFARHVRRVGAIYRERHQILADAITRDFAEHLELIPSTTGLHLTALARNMSADQMTEIARRAADRGIAVQVLSQFAVDAIPRAGIMLGYGAIPTAHIEEGMRLLRACFDRNPSESSNVGRSLRCHPIDNNHT